MRPNHGFCHSRFHTLRSRRRVRQPRDLVIAYIVGITQAMTSGDEAWREDRMLATTDAVFPQRAETTLSALFRDCEAFTAGTPQHYEGTLLIMKLAASTRTGSVALDVTHNFGLSLACVKNDVYCDFSCIEFAFKR